MSLVSQVRTALRAVFRRDAVEREMNDELQFHLERETARWVAGGMTPREAARKARTTFGGVDVAREGMRDERGTRWLEDAVRDARLGVRALARRPLYWATAAVTLGLGIAAATSIFSLVSLVLLRPLAVDRPDDVVVLGQDGRQLGSATPSISLPTLRDIAALDQVFAGAAAYANESIGVRDAGHADTGIWYANAVTGNYFTLLGLEPAAGRLITQADEDRRDPVVVLSDAEWERRYARDPRVIGSAVQLNGAPFTIIGVAPAGWHGMEHLVHAQAYVPLLLEPVLGGRSQDAMAQRGADFLRGFARLRPGKSVVDARVALDVLADRVAPERGEKVGDYRFLVEVERRARPVIVVADFIPAIAATFMTLAMLALLIACVNVGNLVLSRTVARSGELGIRRALGASRGRVARELLAESAVLGLSALAVAIPVAWLVVAWLGNLQFAADVPITIDVRLDRSVLAFTTVAAVLAGLVTGLAPALRGSANVPGQALREVGTRATGSRGKRRLGSVLLVGQLAFSLVLVIAGAIFLRSLRSITSLDLGVDPTGVAMATVDLSLNRYSESRARSFFDRAEAGIAGLPGVTHAGHLRDAPMGYSQTMRYIEHTDGRLVGEQRAIVAQGNSLTPGGIAALRMRLLDGRAFDQFDDSTAPRRALVNETMARRLWPGRQHVVGERFKVKGSAEEVEVVGVVHGVTSEFPTEAPVPQYFTPYAQGGGLSRTFYARFAGAPDASLDEMRGVFRAIDPAVAISDLRPMYTFLHEGKAFFLYKMASTLTTAIGLMGLLQTLVGLYGVIAYGVSQRQREFGIRLALGAGRSELVRQVIRPAARGVGLGAALGLAGAAAILPMAGSVLAVSPRDPLTYGLCAAGLVVLALVALYLPARQAANAPPVSALRGE